MPGMSPEILEALWESPQNWKWGGIYFCKEDPRVIVPKRQKWMGWTINCARPAAIPTLLALIVFISLPLVCFPLFITTRQLPYAWLWYAAIAVAEIPVLCLICWYLASKKRY